MQRGQAAIAGHSLRLVPLQRDPGMTPPPGRHLRAADSPTIDLDGQLRLVAQGDRVAFERVYDALAGPVYRLVTRVLRDPAQSEEVTQEIFVEVWRGATHFDPDRGSATTWVMTVAHRRAVDRVRSAQASLERERRVGRREHATPFDEVAETVETRMEHEQVRRALDSLTALQREAVSLAYYRGYTQREVADLLGLPLGTVKTRLRDGMIRLRDALAVTT